MLAEVKKTYNVIEFNPTEFTHVALAGFLRQCENINKKRPEAYGQATYGFDIHIQGALAEAAVAKFLDKFWGPGKLRATDVGQYQVRSTPNKPPYLCLHPNDSNDAVFILVLVRGVRAALMGWTTGREGKKQEYWGDKWKTNRPAYWVPHIDLKPMESLE